MSKENIVDREGNDLTKSSSVEGLDNMFDQMEIDKGIRPPKEDPPAGDPPAGDTTPPVDGEKPVDTPPKPSDGDPGAQDPPVEDPKPEPTDVKGVTDNLFEDPPATEPPSDASIDPNAPAPPAADPVDDDLKKELDEILSNPQTKESTKKSIDRLTTAIDSEKENSKKVQAELSAEIAALKTQLESSSGGLTEEQQKENADRNAELQQFRRRYGLENDPEVKSKYGDKIAAVDQDIESILNRYGMKEESGLDSEGKKTLGFDEIKAQGGFSEYAQKNPTVYKWLIDKIAEHNPMDADILRGHLREQNALKREKQNFINQESEKADEYFQKVDARQQEILGQAEQQEKKFDEMRVLARDHAVKEADYLQKQEIKKDTGPDARKAIEAHNEKAEKYRGHLDVLYRPDTPEDIIAMANATIMALHLKDTNKSLQTELASVKDQLAKIKQASKPAADNTGGQPPEPVKPADADGPKNIDDAFTAAGQGKLKHFA